MPAYPRYTITAVNPYDDNAGEDGVDSRNPSWCVCFLRFKEPAANFISKKSDPVDTFAPLVVENDCVAVTISRPKGNFAKTASLTMRIGQIYYQNACAPGDWVFIWMSDQQEKIDKIQAWKFYEAKPMKISCEQRDFEVKMQLINTIITWKRV